MPLLAIRELSLAFGGPKLLDEAQFTIEPRERVCLIGRNGEGKSTLLKLVSGEIEPDKAQFEKQPGVRISYLQQDVPDSISGTVFDIAVEGAGALSELLKKYHAASLELGSPDADIDLVLEKMSDLQHELETQGAWHLEKRVEQVLSKLKLDADTAFDSLSGGMKRRALLGRALVSEPDLLLLDEPTNHLDFESIEWLEEFLPQLNVALLFVTHDRAFLRKIATRILELDRGKLVNFDCDYDTYLQRKEELLEAEAKQNDVFDKKLAQEEAWIRRGIRARGTRNEGRVRALKEMRKQRTERRELKGAANFAIAGSAASGRKVATINELYYSWGEMPIVRDFSTTIWRGDKIGVIGANGAGKTTFLKLLLGQLQPDAGSVVLGTNIEVAYFDQHRAQVDPKKTVREAVCEDNEFVHIGGEKRHIFSYLSDFLFTPERAQSPVSSLSGGELNRLLLARIFTKNANVMVLDEPTNDLDIETLELLEEKLLDFAGTVLLVSHDRDFLDSVVTHTIALEANGRIRETVGGYQEYERDIRHEKLQTMGVVQKAEKKGKKSWKEDKPRVLTNREKRELEEVPKKIEELETSQEEWVAKLSDLTFISNAENVKEANEKLALIESELELVFARWEELEAIPEKV